MKIIKIALCGMTPAQQRLMNTALDWHGLKFGSELKTQVFPAQELIEADVAIVDGDAPRSWEDLTRLRLVNYKMPTLFVSDHGDVGDSPFRLTHETALHQLGVMLHLMLDTKFPVLRNREVPAPHSTSSTLAMA